MAMAVAEMGHRVAVELDHSLRRLADHVEPQDRRIAERMIDVARGLPVWFGLGLEADQIAQLRKDAQYLISHYEPWTKGGNVYGSRAQPGLAVVAAARRVLDATSAARMEEMAVELERKLGE